jgi:translation initiation factor 1 (eIF-1/SUI1)
MIRNGSKNVLVMLVLLFSLMTNGFITPVLAENQTGETVTVIGEKGDVLLKETAINLSNNLTAFDALLKTIGSTNLVFTESEYGKMITSIKGLEAKGNFFWAFYINGMSSQVGADQYIVQKGDHISFRYVDWTASSDQNVSIKVTGNKGIVKEVKNIAFVDEPTALQALQAILGGKVEVAETQYGKMITAIEGIKAEGTYYWAFYLNGQMATVGADSYKLKAGDEIHFSYESWETAPEEEEQDPGEVVDPIQSPSPVLPASQVKAAMEAAAKYTLKNYVGEWEAIALKQAGKEVPKSYLSEVSKLVEEKQGRFSKITDYERYSLGIVAAGGNPTNISGYNLIEAIYNGHITKQGLNGVFYALIALDSGNFEIPGDAKWTREHLVKHLIENQNMDYGWSWDGSEKSDIDTTAMVVTALAPYNNKEEVKTAIKGAVEYLSKQYQLNKIDNSSTAAQVIVALSSIGIDANNTPFTKDNSSLMTYLLSYQNKDGGFDWQGGDKSDVMSTSQGILGIVGYYLFLNNSGLLYQLPLNPVTDTPETNNDQIDTTIPEPADGNTEDGKEGLPLPNTATPIYNYLLIGILFVVLSAGIWMNDKRKKA